VLCTAILMAHSSSGAYRTSSNSAGGG